MTATTVIQETKVLWDRTADKLYVWDNVSKSWELFFVAADVVTNDQLTDALALKLDKAGGGVAGDLTVAGKLGVGGATPDANNPVAMQIASMLLTNPSGALNVTVSKHAAADDARFAFQTNYSTRALFGLLGDDNLAIKVSPNGSAFVSAIVADKTTGALTLAVDLPITEGGTGASSASAALANLGGLAASAYTASDVLAKIKTVDGSGSGLDADVLDGQEGNYYLAWGNLTGKPSTFPPSAHSHAIADVTGLQAALDATLSASSYTAADVLAKIKTVDGSGSGLDADLLDGHDSGYFTDIPSRLGYTPFNAAGGTVGGNTTISGTLGVSSAATFSSSCAAASFTTAGRVTGADASIGGIVLTAAGGDFFAAGYKLWSSNNDGAASGMDADFLDGQHGSYYLAWANFTGVPSTFAPSAHTHAIADVTSLQTALDAKLAASAYTASDVLAKLIAVDGSGSSLDADQLDGHDSGYFTDIPARLGYTPFNAAGGTIGGNTAISGTLSVTGDVTFSGTVGAKFEAVTNYDNYIAANTWTKIAFNSANHNDQGAFGASGNRFTAPAAGYYLIGLKWRFKANATAPVSIQTKLYKNGSALDYTAAESDGTVVTLKTSLATQTVMKLAANDYVEAWAFMETNDGYVGSAESVFYGARIA